MATSRRRLKLATAKDLEAAIRAWRQGRSKFTFAEHTECYRVLRAGSADEAEHFASECYASDSFARYSPVRQDRRVIPSAYAAMTSQAALWETALRNIRHMKNKRVPASDVRDHYLVRVRVTRNLILLDTRKPLDQNLVFGTKAAPDLSGAPKEEYGITRRWANDLYFALRNMQGVIYSSHQIDASCVVVYQSKRLNVFEVQGKAQLLTKPPLRAILIREAGRVGAVIDFDDPEDEYLD